MIINDQQETRSRVIYPNEQKNQAHEFVTAILQGLVDNGCHPAEVLSLALIAGVSVSHDNGLDFDNTMDTISRDVDLIMDAAEADGPVKRGHTGQRIS